jgi:hypothetical protein
VREDGNRCIPRPRNDGDKSYTDEEGAANSIQYKENSEDSKKTPIRT